MDLIRWSEKALDPVDMLDRFQQELDEFFEGPRSPAARGLFDRSVAPAIDVVETDDHIIVTCDVPGISKDDIELTFADGILTIKGEKMKEAEKNGSTVYRQEMWEGRFQRTIGMPEAVDPKKIDAKLDDGVLTAAFTKREETKPKKIAIGVK